MFRYSRKAMAYSFQWSVRFDGRQTKTTIWKTIKYVTIWSYINIRLLSMSSIDHWSLLINCMMEMLHVPDDTLRMYNQKCMPIQMTSCRSASLFAVTVNDNAPAMYTIPNIIYDKQVKNTRKTSIKLQSNLWNEIFLKVFEFFVSGWKLSFVYNSLAVQSFLAEKSNLFWKTQQMNFYRPLQQKSRM